jgi:hypothetical protein
LLLTAASIQPPIPTHTISYPSLQAFNIIINSWDVTRAIWPGLEPAQHAGDDNRAAAQAIIAHEQRGIATLADGVITHFEAQ